LRPELRAELLAFLDGFNPTLVRLRLAIPEKPWQTIPCFNPTLVRLRHEHPSAGAGVRREFQSHAGSIEALVVAKRFLELEKFQSHAGSIEACTWIFLRIGFSCVSIPRWFD